MSEYLRGPGWVAEPTKGEGFALIPDCYLGPALLAARKRADRAKRIAQFLSGRTYH